MSPVHPITFKTIPSLHELKQGFPGVLVMLFDMDGTLFDTEKYHEQALQLIAYEKKIRPPMNAEELHLLMMGKADHLIYEIAKDWPGFPAQWSVRDFVGEKNKKLLQILSKADATKYFHLPLKNLLFEAKKTLKIGLVTSSEKVITTELLKLTGLETTFDYILTRDDSVKVKPDPWPYLTAMKFFNSDGHSTMIFEDSNVGIEAARASGAHVIKAEWF